MEAPQIEILRAVIVEATVWKKAEIASKLALKSSRENVKLSVSSDVNMEGLVGKKELMLAEMAYRLSVLRFEAQAVYAFTRSGIGRLSEEVPDPSTTMRDATFVKLATVVSINALRFLISDILHTTGSMN